MSDQSAEITDQQRTELYAAFLKMLHVLYEEGRNPLYVWKGLLFCAQEGIKLPAWIVEYLARSAIAIDQIPAGTGDPEQHVYRALEFATPGRGDFFSKHDQLIRKGADAFRLDKLKEITGDSVNKLSEELEVDPRTFRQLAPLLRKLSDI